MGMFHINSKVVYTFYNLSESRIDSDYADDTDFSIREIF